MTYRKPAAVFLSIFLAFFFTPIVFAHGDEPRLEISPDRMNPGGVIDVRGVDFGAEELITLSLIRQDVEISLGETTADVEGVFIQIVTLPVDMAEGTYNFLAVTDDHKILSPNLTVQGPPIYR
ncbi:MAG TPA: hypothetical protein VJ022_13685 [Anaerolineales bacterium]|nr:hypothetical protein [Anaerolineales bacterium]